MVSIRGGLGFGNLHPAGVLVFLENFIRHVMILYVSVIAAGWERGDQELNRVRV